MKITEVCSKCKRIIMAAYPCPRCSLKAQDLPEAPKPELSPTDEGLTENDVV